MKTNTVVNRVKKLVKSRNQKTIQTTDGPAQPVSPDIFAQKVEKKAYELFEQRDCQNGCDWDDWFQAEKIVEDEMIAGQ